MTSLQVKQVNKQGQSSIGKKFAGKTIQIDEYDDGTIVLKPVEIISEFELRLLKDRVFHERLAAFDRWESEHSPTETDIAHLEKDLETRSEFS